MLITTEDVALRHPLRDIFPELAAGPSSRGSTYWGRSLHCGREHLFSNVLNWDPVQLSDALDMGLMWHLALERFYTVRMRVQHEMGRDAPRDVAFFQAGHEEAVAAAYTVPDALEGYEDYDKSTWRGRLERMLKSYIGFARDPWEVLAVEDEFATTREHHGLDYTSRLDLLVRDYTIPGWAVIRHIEHKSSTYDNPQHLKAFTHDLQTWGQTWVIANNVGARWPGETYRGGLVNITTKGGDGERTRAVPRCHRVEIMPSWPALLGWRDAMIDAQARRDSFHLRDWPKNFTQCSRKYGLCPFFDVCLKDADTGVRTIGRPYKGADFAAGVSLGPFFVKRPVNEESR